MREASRTKTKLVPTFGGLAINSNISNILTVSKMPLSKALVTPIVWKTEGVPFTYKWLCTWGAFLAPQGEKMRQYWPITVSESPCMETFTTIFYAFRVVCNALGI